VWHHQRRAKPLLRRLPPRLAHGLQPSAILQQAHRSGGHILHISNGIQQPRHPVVDQLRHPAHARGDRRNLAGHGLQRRQPKRLQLTRHHHQIGQRQQLIYPLLLAHEVNTALNSQVVRQPFGSRAVRPVADKN